MTNDRARKEQVGDMLAARRDALDFTQAGLAGELGISQRSVSAVERGEHGIQRGKRARWESALYLQRGTISRAYRDGTPLETIDITGGPDTSGPEPWTQAEWEIYTVDEPKLDEVSRREMVNFFREAMHWPPRRDWTPPPTTDERAHRLA